VAGFALHHLLWRRRHAAALLSAAAGGIVAGTLLMDRLTGGWHTWYVFRPHGLLPHRFFMFWLVDVLPLLPVAVLGAMFLLARRGQELEKRRFYATFAAVTVGTGLFGRMISGAYLNALLPACAGLALMLGLALHEAQGLLPVGDRRWPLEALLLGAVLVQLAMLVYDPRAQLPTAADRQAGERLTARLAGLGPSVVVPSHPYLAARASGHAHAHAMATADVLHLAPAPVRDALERDMRQALCQHRFSAVVTDGTWRYQSQLLRDYGPPLPLPELGDAFWTVTGARTRPSTLYMPRASGADCFE
jgi:hypothetical protein